MTTLSERHRNQLRCNVSSVLAWKEGKEVQLKPLLALVLNLFLWDICDMSVNVVCVLISVFISWVKGCNLFPGSLDCGKSINQYVLNRKLLRKVDDGLWERVNKDIQR